MSATPTTHEDDSTVPIASLEVGGERVLIYPECGPLLARESDANDLIGAAWEHGTTWIALPVSAIHDDFFRLETRLAGHIVQKLVNYRLRTVVIGNIDAWLARSAALRAFVHESNRGNALWFVPDLKTLAQRLAGGAGHTP